MTPFADRTPEEKLYILGAYEQVAQKRLLTNSSDERWSFLYGITLRLEGFIAASPDRALAASLRWSSKRDRRHVSGGAA